MFITFSNIAYSQNDASFLKLKKGIAFTDSGSKIRFKSVQETENSFIFMTTNRTEIEIEKFRIAQIDKQKGNYAAKYALGGTGIGFLGMSTILFVSIANSDSEFNMGDGAFIGIIAGSTGLFFGIFGGLIGFFEKRHKTVYQTSSIGNHTPMLKLKTTLPNAIPSLTLSYSF